MKRYRGIGRIAFAISLAALWLVGDLAQPLSAKRGFERGAGDIGDPGGLRTLDNRARRNVNRNRVDFWDEAEDEHTKRMVLGIGAGILVGTLIAKPPKNSQKTQANGQEYYYSDGNYYEPKGDQYEVVAAPTGATVNKLPEGAKKVQVGDDVYFAAGDVFYRPAQTGNEVLFEVVPSPF